MLFHWLFFVSDFFLLRDSPLSSILRELWTILSSIASAMVCSPITSCQALTGRVPLCHKLMRRGHVFLYRSIPVFQKNTGMESYPALFIVNFNSAFTVNDTDFFAYITERNTVIMPVFV